MQMLVPSRNTVVSVSFVHAGAGDWRSQPWANAAGPWRTATVQLRHLLEQDYKHVPLRGSYPKPVRAVRGSLAFKCRPLRYKNKTMEDAPGKRHLGQIENVKQCVFCPLHHYSEQTRRPTTVPQQTEWTVSRLGSAPLCPAERRKGPAGDLAQRGPLRS